MSAPPNVDIEVSLCVDMALVGAVVIVVFAKVAVVSSFVILAVFVVGAVVGVAWMKVVAAVALGDALVASTLV